MENNNDSRRTNLTLGEFDVKVILDCLDKQLTKELTDWVQFMIETRTATHTENAICTEVSQNVASRFKAPLDTSSHKSNKTIFIMEDKKFFALCYLNKSSLFNDSKHWQISSIYDHYPTKEELQKTDLLGTGTDYDNRLIDIIADPSKHIARLVYSEDESDWCEKFFEVSVWKFTFGQDLKMSDYFTTGYCDMMSDEHIVIKGSDE